MDYRRYDTLILLSPNLGPELVEAFKGKIEGIVAAGSGQIVRFEEWGRRRLAYPVQKETYGYYVLWDYRGLPPLADEIERNCKIDEQVFKYMTLVLEKGFTEERLQQVLDQLAAEASRKEKEKEKESAAAEAAKADGSRLERSEGGRSDRSDRSDSPDRSDRSDSSEGGRFDR